MAGKKGETGKLDYCFVDFRKAFDTVPSNLLWQVLEEIGIRGASRTSSSLCTHVHAVHFHFPFWV